MALLFVILCSLVCFCVDSLVHQSLRTGKARLPSIQLFQQLVTKEDFDQDADNALIERLEAEIMATEGVELDQLINPGKVVNLERELVVMERILADESVGAQEKAELKVSMEEKRTKLAQEKRLVMRGWLKNLFVGQSVLAAAISLGMVYDAVPGAPLPLAVQVLGFWMWWLFIVPSLRARKPAAKEKEALNIAFLATPLVSVIMPSFTKDTGTIWWGNAAAMAVCYSWAYLKPESEDKGVGGGIQLPPWLRKIWLALDYGSGQERGVRRDGFGGASLTTEKAEDEGEGG